MTHDHVRHDRQLPLHGVQSWVGNAVGRWRGSFGRRWTRSTGATRRHLLDAHPDLVVERAGYVARPYLLWFVAENPIRRGRLADGILDVTRELLDVVRAAAEAGRAPAMQVDHALALWPPGGCRASRVGNGWTVLAMAWEVEAVRHLARRGARESGHHAIAESLRDT